ncbi:MAG: 6-phospho-beta-glucosidase [Nocardioidaceae bacterium]
MRLTVLGGGGFRVPLIFRSLLADDQGSPVRDLVLYDIDERRLRLVAAVLSRLTEETGSVAGRVAPRVHLSTDLPGALRGADFVFSAVRVGGLTGRVCDERAALAEGLLGQETTGAGGVCYGLRTVPVAVRIAETVREVAPDAWVINFTNPAGMVTEAMTSVLGDRVVGICDSPVGLFRRVARALAIDPEQAWFEYAGLNHLGWLQAVLLDGRDRLPELLADVDRLDTFEEGRLFGAERLQSLGCLPNEYLWYWYFTADAVRAGTQAAETRGEFLHRQQSAFYDAEASGDVLRRWQDAHREREETYLAEGRAQSGAGERDALDLEGGGYDQVALALMRSIAGDRRTTLVLNVRNRSALTGLDSDAVVEVPCTVDADGPQPLATQPLGVPEMRLVRIMKEVDRATIHAARTGSLALATRALAMHPLVGSMASARRLLEAERAQLPELARVLVR